ncbi:MAG: glycosyltransferase family 9 protein [candidate division KSB1 bacterium]|nr:glycosyltransferase family 9 protein [candidate division KSB1 bacterium]
MGRTKGFDNVDRVLVIKLRAIGDVLMSLPVIDNLRSFLPEAAVDFLTEREPYPIVARYPGIREVLVFDRRAVEGAHPIEATKRSLQLFQQVRRRGYDLVLDLFGNPRSALVTALSGAPLRVGFDWRVRKWAYNVVVPSRADQVHEVEFNLDALRALGIPIRSRAMRWPVSREAEREAEAFFLEHGLIDGRVVALNPGGGWATKRWPPQRFADLARWIVDELGREVLILWGPGEEKLAREAYPAGTPSVYLLPRTDLLGLAAFLCRCEALVTNDSGAMHLAAAVGLPVVAIFGPTRPELQGPWGVPHRVVRHRSISCLGCNKTSCRHPRCMAEIGVDEVASALQELLDEGPSARQSAVPDLREVRASGPVRPL